VAQQARSGYHSDWINDLYTASLCLIASIARAFLELPIAPMSMGLAARGFRSELRVDQRSKSVFRRSRKPLEAEAVAESLTAQWPQPWLQHNESKQAVRAAKPSS